MARDIEQKTVFAVLPQGQSDGVPLLLIGIPAGAWEYMKDGKTHTFDLTGIGLPIKLMLYGGANHAEVKKTVEDLASARGVPLLDQRREDFSIKPDEPIP